MKFVFCVFERVSEVMVVIYFKALLHLKKELKKFVDVLIEV